MLIIGGQLEGYRSLKDKTLKITFETQEPTPEQLVSIAGLSQRFGFIAFKEDTFKEKEKEMLESLESTYKETGKTKGQRLRGVLYRNFELDNLGYKVFDDYYSRKMEEIIEHYKSKLP
jgi:hypothetical protein